MRRRRRAVEAPIVTVLTLCAGLLGCTEGRAEDSAPDSTQWRHEQRLLGQTTATVDIALLEDPDLMLTVGWQRVTIWNVQSANQEVSFSYEGMSSAKRRGGVHTVLADSEARRIVVASASRIGVWDGKTGRELHRFEAVDLRRHVIALSLDGRWLAARTDESEVTVWDLDTGPEAFSRMKLAAKVASLALSGDGSRLAVGGPGRMAVVYEAGPDGAVMSVLDHPKDVYRVDITPDGSRLATASKDGLVNIWDVASRERVATLQTTGRLGSMRMRPRGRRVLTSTGKGPLRLWNVGTGAVVRTFGPGDLLASHLRLSPDGSRVAAVEPREPYAAEHNHRVWMTNTGRPAPSFGNREWTITGVHLSSNGERALAVDPYGDAVLVDTITGAKVREFMAPAVAPQPDGAEARSGDPRVRRSFRLFRVLGDGRHVLDISREGGIVVHDADADIAVGSFRDGPTPDYPCVLSPDHRLLLTGDAEGNAHLWDVETRSFLRTLPGDGSRVLSASFDGDRVGKLRTKMTGAHAISVSPDGRHALIWRRRPTVPTATLWDLERFRPVGPQSADGVYGCVWRPDSRRFYTGAYEGRQYVARAWEPLDFTVDAAMRPDSAWVRPAVHYRGEPAPATLASQRMTIDDTPLSSGMLPLDQRHGVYRIAISRDGSTFAALSAGGSVDIWRRAGDGSPEAGPGSADAEGGDAR